MLHEILFKGSLNHLDILHLLVNFFFILRIKVFIITFIIILCMIAQRLL